jgi:hypothetical protein
MAPRRRSTRATTAASTERAGVDTPHAPAATPSPAYKAGSAMRTTSLLMLLQIGSRLLTFVLNALVARQIGPALYGIANVHFYLVYTTILFVAREGLRRACLRSGSFAVPSAASSSSSSSSSSESPPSHPMRGKLVEIINLVWLCGMPLALVLALALGGLAWAHPPLQDPHYTLSLGLYVASALIEMVRFSTFVLCLSFLECRTLKMCILIFFLFHSNLAFPFSPLNTSR